MNKCKLNEFCQKHGLKPASYAVDNPTGPPHSPTYKNCTVTIGETRVEVQQVAGSKKEMENLAALEALEKMERLSIYDTKGEDHDKKAAERAEGSAAPSGHAGPSGSPPWLSRGYEKHLEKEGLERVYLVDYDNVSDTPLDTLDGEIHLFVSLSFNLKTKKMEQIRAEKNVEIHQASAPLPELVDHMMTWYAARNYNKWMRVTVVSRDSGLNALVEILKLNGVECTFFNDFNV